MAAHAAQFAFLVFFENPRTFTLPFIQVLSLKFLADIERLYGQRKAIAKRTPIVAKHRVSGSDPQLSDGPVPQAELDRVTPAVNDGETASETDLEMEMDDEVSPFPDARPIRKIRRHEPKSSIDSVTSSNGDATPPETTRQRSTSTSSHSQRTRAISQHDLLNKYFKRDAVVLRNVDLLRYEARLHASNHSDVDLNFIFSRVTERLISCSCCLSLTDSAMRFFLRFRHKLHCSSISRMRLHGV